MREVYCWYYDFYKLTRSNRHGQLAGECKIVIGVMGKFGKSWIRTNIEYLNILCNEHWQMWFIPNPVDALLADHVWKHLTPEEGELAVRHCFIHLRPGGYLRAAVPDGYHSDPDYIDPVKINGTGPSTDGHKVFYIQKTFIQVFADISFEVELLEYFDEEDRFHEVNWDPAVGRIRRPRRYNRRNRDGSLRYTSIILEAGS
jgi:predicted SAM-dependent methyltransferase